MVKARIEEVAPILSIDWPLKPTETTIHCRIRAMKITKSVGRRTTWIIAQ